MFFFNSLGREHRQRVYERFITLFFIDFDVFFEFHHLANSAILSICYPLYFEFISCLIELGNVIWKVQRVYFVHVMI